MERHPPKGRLPAHAGEIAALQERIVSVGALHSVPITIRAYGCSACLSYRLAHRLKILDCPQYTIHIDGF